MRAFIRGFFSVVILTCAAVLQAGRAGQGQGLDHHRRRRVAGARLAELLVATTRDVLKESGRFDVDVVGGAEVLANEANLKNVDVIYLMLTTPDSDAFRQGQGNLPAS